MDNLTREIIISSLFKAGFDVVDPYTYTYVLDKIINSENKDFNFNPDDKGVSAEFAYFVKNNNGVYSLKDESELENSSLICDAGKWLESPVDTLNFSNILVQFIINSVDMEDLVKRKMKYYGILSYSDYDKMFSTKEKEIRTVNFGAHYKSVVSSVDDNNCFVRIKKEGNH